MGMGMGAQPRQHTTVVHSYSPFGFGMPFGGFGWGFRPVVFAPLGGVFSFMLMMLAATVVFNLVRVSCLTRCSALQCAVVRCAAVARRACGAAGRPQLGCARCGCQHRVKPVWVGS